MKLICKRNEMTEIINMVQKAVSAKSTMPILECIKLDAEISGKFVITGNNLELCVEYTGECNVEEPGSIALNSRIFGDMIRKFTDEDILIEVNQDNNLCFIKCGKSEFNIQGLNADEYPLIPEIDETYRFSMKQPVLRNMIRKTIFAAAINDSRRPIITGSLFEIESGTLTMVATDGYRLALMEEVVDSSLKNTRFVIPGLSLKEIFKVLKEEDETVDIIISKRHVLFDFGVYKIVTRLLEGEFIKYRPILATPNSIFVRVDTTKLINSLERAALLISDDITAKNEKVPVRFKISTDRIELTCTTGRGKINDVVDINLYGDEIEVGFNHKYILEALKACGEEEVKIEFSNSKSPCFIKSKENSAEKYIYMILPVRLYD